MVVFKNIITPVQAWLLSRGRCVGCGLPLQKGKRENRGKETELVSCKCGRIFIYHRKTGRYRRALMDEI